MSENNEARIQGGYILLARTIIDNPDVFQNCPPIRTQLWLWMLMEAFWRDGEMLKRGQLITSIDEMREAMSYKVGYRLETPTRDEIRSAYGAFARAGMIEVQKTMRGMVISVVNYDAYQTAENYKNQTSECVFSMRTLKQSPKATQKNPADSAAVRVCGDDANPESHAKIEPESHAEFNPESHAKIEPESHAFSLLLKKEK